MALAEQSNDVRVAPAFLSLMSHELTQPLSAALGSVYTLKERSVTDQLDRATTEHLFDTVIRNLEQLHALLNSLQVFSEAEAGNLKVRRQVVSVAELFMDAEEDFGSPLSKTNVSFEAEPGLQMQVELMLFRQVLTNLINNADKFSPKGSLISIEAHQEGDNIVITVRDEGGGFPPEEAERIFGKSVRLQPGKKGLGVGLFVAKAIVEAHGGRIWAQNTNSGACFSVSVPAA